MADNYTLVKDQLGFYRVDPVPTQQVVEKFYAEEFYSGEYKSFNDSSKEVQIRDKEFYEGHWEDIRTHLIRFLERDQFSLFDIGCGFGLALNYYQSKGIRVSGLDPAPEAISYARSNGIDAHVSGIEDYTCTGEDRFDVVTLINVLEHLRQPAETLRRIKDELLAEDGILVVDVPNEFNDFQVIANEEHDLKEWWVCPPNHLNYFSCTSLKSLLEQCGYEVLYTEASFPLELFMVMGDIYVGNEDLGRQCHLKRVEFEKMMRKHGKTEKLYKLYSALADLNLGRQIVAFARAAK
jgi:2-polyprenyl-3-methyl-5-hydroxy-6-metoxy-1,4-benzoquinol methylase